ncbi:MAG: hypothetical protein HC884_14535 [Chloroflexaceae bacterium]|nr:hypothetical protein [Chloroflexaceae bacterium]
MSYDGLLLLILTSRHRYLAPRSQILELCVMTGEASRAQPGEQAPPTERFELGPLLDPQDPPGRTRRHALLVPTPTQNVVLLVDRVEDMWLEPGERIQAFPPFFARKLRRPWFPGAMLYHDVPVLVLDLCRIAQDALNMGREARWEA